MRSVIRNKNEWKLFTVSLVLGFGFVIAMLFVVETSHASESPGIQEIVFSKENHTAFARKLLALDEDDDGEGGGGGDNGSGGMNRVGATCSKDNIVIFQGPTTPLPNGIPTYTVQILNVCVSGCSVSNIHLSCGWFSSARLINPRVFRRVCYDDCLVNDGEALSSGESLSFEYANSFQYPLYVSSVACF